MRPRRGLHSLRSGKERRVFISQVHSVFQPHSIVIDQIFMFPMRIVIMKSLEAGRPFRK